MSTAADRLARLLALVPWLIVNDGIAIADAAAHFGISVAQLEDDLNLLICCGLPGYSHAELVDIQFWEDDRIHVLDPQTLARPLRLSGDEGIALTIALRLLAQIPGDHDRDALHSATLRLQSAIGDIDRGVVVDPGVTGEVSLVIAEALAAGDDLELEYGGASDEVTTRVVHPIRTLTHDGRTYLEAQCHRAGALRTFRLDRILRVSVLPHTPIPADAAVPAGAAVPAPKPVRARIAVEAPWVAEALGAPGDVAVIEVSVIDEAWLIRTVLSLGGAAEVLEPAALRLAVADAARRALASYA